MESEINWLFVLSRSSCLSNDFFSRLLKLSSLLSARWVGNGNPLRFLRKETRVYLLHRHVSILKQTASTTISVLHSWACMIMVSHASFCGSRASCKWYWKNLYVLFLVQSYCYLHYFPHSRPLCHDTNLKQIGDNQHKHKNPANRVMRKSNPSLDMHACKNRLIPWYEDRNGDKNEYDVRHKAQTIEEAFVPEHS